MNCLTEAQKNQFFTKKRPFLANFSLKMANFATYQCCKWIFRDLCASLTCFFLSSTPEIGAGVLQLLVLSKKTQFLTKKRPFLAVFFQEKWQFFVHTHAVNCVFVICVPLKPLFRIQHPQNRGGVFNCLSEAKKLNR